VYGVSETVRVSEENVADFRALGVAVETY